MREESKVVLDKLNEVFQPTFWGKIHFEEAMVEKMKSDVDFRSSIQQCLLELIDEITNDFIKNGDSHDFNMMMDYANGMKRRLNMALNARRNRCEKSRIMRRNNLSINEVINLRGIYREASYDLSNHLNTMGCCWIGICKEILDAMNNKSEHSVAVIDDRYVIFRDGYTAPEFIQTGNQFINPFWILN